MSVTYGFYNSLNHDRLYNAIQVSSIFDGIIEDGVYMSIGDRFVVKPINMMNVTVGIGRAWFNHTWTLNDALLVMPIPAAELILNRIDTIVIEVNESTRTNDIKVIKGTPSSNPVAPTLTNNSYLHQYPLANIRVNAGTTAITTAMITNRVGTSACPYVTGVLQSMSIDDIVAQWQAEWEDWYADKDYSYNEWFRDKQAELNAYLITLDGTVTSWITNRQEQFDQWFASLDSILDGNVAANLAAEILKLKQRWVVLGSEYAVYDNLQDADGDDILDSDGNKIDSSVVFVVKE